MLRGITNTTSFDRSLTVSRIRLSIVNKRCVGFSISSRDNCQIYSQHQADNEQISLKSVLGPWCGFLLCVFVTFPNTAFDLHSTDATSMVIWVALIFKTFLHFNRVESVELCLACLPLLCDQTWSKLVLIPKGKITYSCV